VKNPFALLWIALLAGCASAPGDLNKIDTIVVIYAENRSFDHLYGLFPGAEGIAQATPEQNTQLDRDGKPLLNLPPVWNHGKPDPAFPTNLANRPFRIDAPPANLPLSARTPDPVHLFYVHQEQIAGGLNNKFAALSNVGALTMGYYDGSSLRMWEWARKFVLADHFFQAAFGGSFLNHQWLVCACTPYNPDAPAAARTQLGADGRVRRREDVPSALDGPLWFLEREYSPDGHAVNSLQPPYQPSGIPPAPGGTLDHADPAMHPLPPQRTKTIGDTLSAKGVTWAWYSGAWDVALTDGRRDPKAARMVIYNGSPASPNFQPHHQPFNYFMRFAPGTADRARHLKDEKDFIEAIDKGALPQVAFYKPAGRVNQHPGSDITNGDEHIDQLLTRLVKSPQWDRMAVIVTYDENGGFWDHVPPPAGPGWGDRWGPGTRIPALVVSPFAKRGFVDKTPYDTTSILKLITRRFSLEPLPGVREKAGDLSNAFSF
jgi:phospholipase C